MCGRFVQQAAGAIPARFGVAPEAVRPLLAPRYNLAPGQAVAIVIEPRPGAREVLAATWGLPPRRGGAAGRSVLLFNARAETLIERAGFRRLLPGGRCLVPADGFYLWEQVGRGKYPWLYALRDGALCAFAGLYDRWADAAGREIVACTIVTTAAILLVLPVHERMPAILPRTDEGAWLDPCQDDPAALVSRIIPYPPGEMTRAAVSTAVNSGRRDDARLVRPYAA
jgi:putative SOS response-associated peptidase YedK